MEARTYSSTLEKSAIVERIARIVSSVRGAKPDYTRLAAELEQAVPFDVFGVVLLRHDRQSVRVTACHRKGSEWTAVYHQHPLADSMLEQVLCAPTLVVKNYPDGLDGPPATSGDALSNYHQLRSTLIAPLVVEERVLGTLELGSVVTNTYADETLQRLIGAVVDVLATAIESVQAGGSAEIQNRQRQALKVVSSALASKMELSTILDEIVVGIARALNVASAIFMLDQRSRKVRLKAQSGLDQEVLGRFFSRDLSISDKCIIGETVQRRQPYVSHDVATDERFPESRIFFTHSGMHSILSYPLVTGTTVYGALLLLSPEPGGFTPLKADILSLFAYQATVAIHNGMLLDAAQQRSHFQEAIERLEQMRERHLAASLSDRAAEREVSEARAQQDELELLEYVRKETQRIFGVSFTSLLRFISDHLLTQNERDLHAILDGGQRGAVLEDIEVSRVESAATFSAEAAVQETANVTQTEDRKNPFADTLSLLSQTAEAALVRAGMVGELSRLIFQLKQSANWVNDPWFVIDLDGLCRYMNPAAETLCGTRLADMTTYNTQSFITALPFDVSVPVENVFEKLRPRIRNIDEVLRYLRDFKQGTAQRRELRWVLAVEPVCARPGLQQIAAKDDSLRLESASSDYHYQFMRYPMYNPQGQLEAYALEVHDVTEQVRDEKNRSALFSSVSHDLRTPLTTIKAAVTGLLQSDVAWSEQDRQAMLEDIDCETDHLTVLVSALVEMSRIEMGALILEKEWCDIDEVMYGAIAKLQRVSAEHPIRVLLPAQQLPLIYIDHVQMERVFYNLIENAARHSPEQAEILVALDIINEGTEMLRARVIDHGSGVPEHERERIFKSFYSLRSYSNGLGLAICKGIIDAHQGRIWADAAPDGGSCFVFTLPTHPYSSGPGGGEAISSTKSALLNDEAARG